MTNWLVVTWIYLFWINNFTESGKSSTKKETCPGSDYAQLDDKCYYFYYDTKSWWNAEEFCESHGGTLLIFQERSEIKLVKKEVKNIAKKLDETARFWLGLKHNADDGEFYWADGSGLTRKKWESRLDDKVSTPGQCVVITAKENSGAGNKKWETQSCENKLPFVCEISLSTSRWSGWGKWNDCSSSCGKGIRQRRRKCLRPTSASTECTGSNMDSSSCNKGNCPVVAAEWSKWSDWTDCSVTCGKGTLSRSRRCLNSKTGSNCKGKDEESKSCSKTACPVPEWSKWSDWTDCSVTCGKGTLTRSRSCLNSKTSSDCKGKDEESKTCLKTACPVAEWGRWSEWTECSVTCGKGTLTRSRRCLNSKTSSDCKGKAEESKSCSQTTCPVTAWGRWSKWTECSVTCGKGTLTRSRSCLNSKTGSDCKGKSQESKSCSKTSCPEWDTWSKWGSCSVTCGTGQKQRTRKCLNSKNSNECTGSSKQAVGCTEKDCIVVEWGRWSDWTGCSVTCGKGTLTRSRSCLNSRTGSDCKGRAKESKSCSKTPCPEWATWSKWESCSVTCGTGNKQRTRKCLNSKNSNDCTGSDKQTIECTEKDCIGSWSKWSKWGQCSVTCDNGRVQRQRTCSTLPTLSCHGKSEETKKCSIKSKCPDNKKKKKKRRHGKIRANKTKNKGIVGHEIWTTTAETMIKCALYCARLPDECQSFNYEFKIKRKDRKYRDDRTCILNSVALTEYPSDLKSMPGFKAFDMGTFWEESEADVV